MVTNNSADIPNITAAGKALLDDANAAAQRTTLGAAALAGDTFTGVVQFSGTGHAGVKLNNLTTTQRDALTPAAGMVIYNTTTASVQRYDADSWDDVGGAEVAQTRTFFVSKNGNDSNAGTSINKSFLTIGAAKTAVDALSPIPSTTARATIIIPDGGSYSELVNVPAHTTLYGPSATVASRVQLNDGSVAVLREIRSSQGYAVWFSSTSTDVDNRMYVKAQRITNTSSTGSGLAADSGGIGIVDVDFLDVTNTSAKAIDASGASILHVRVGQILATNTTSIAIKTTGTSSVYCHATEINGTTAYDVAASTTLSLLCELITGTRTNAGSVHFMSLANGVIQTTNTTLDIRGANTLRSINSASSVVHQWDANGWGYGDVPTSSAAIVVYKNLNDFLQGQMVSASGGTAARAGWVAANDAGKSIDTYVTGSGNTGTYGANTGMLSTNADTLNTNSTVNTKMRVDGTVITTVAATGMTLNVGELLLTQQPGFRAYLAGDATNVTGNNTAYTIIADTEDFDGGADYNNATGVFTAPVAGRYCFSVTMATSGHTVGSTSYTAELRNSAGTVLHTLFKWNPTGVALSGALINTYSAILELAATDTVKVVLTVNGEGSDVIDITSGNTAGTIFAGWLLG